MIKEGMVVRTNDGTKIGRVDQVREAEFEIVSGILFRHRFWASRDDIVDERDGEIICRNIELPEEDREIKDMPFGCAETADELATKTEEEVMREELLHPHP